jgi:hypothetical protein
MSRIIIDIPDDAIGLSEAMQCVREVILMGRVSKTTKGVKHFCWHTSFKNGLGVSARVKKKGQKSDSFVVVEKKSQVMEKSHEN